MLSRFVLTLAAVLVCVAPTAITAGTVVELQIVGYMPGFDDGTGVLYIDKNNARSDSHTGKNDQVLIYSGDGEPRLWLINDAEWSYNEVTKKNIGDVRGKLQNRVEQFDQYLSRLDRAEREATQKQFGGQIRVIEVLLREDYEKKTSFEKVESGVAIGDLKCDVYERSYYDQFDNLKVYVASWDQVDASPENFVVVHDIVDRFQAFGSEFAWLGQMWSDEVTGRIDGFPMRIVMYSGETKAMRVDVTAIRHEDLDAKLFQLPEDYDEKPFMEMEK